MRTVVISGALFQEHSCNQYWTAVLMGSFRFELGSNIMIASAFLLPSFCLCRIGAIGCSSAHTTFVRRAPRLVKGATSALRFQACQYSRTPPRMSTNLSPENISKIIEKEREITGSDGLVKGGPTAQGQKNVGQPINSKALHDITQGEKKITGSDGPAKGGLTSTAQTILTRIFFPSTLRLPPQLNYNRVAGPSHWQPG